MLPTECGLNLEETSRDHPGRPVPEASLRPSPRTRFAAIGLPQRMIAALVCLDALLSRLSRSLLGRRLFSRGTSRLASQTVHRRGQFFDALGERLHIALGRYAEAV